MSGSEKYIWTWHSRDKMKYYRLSESRITRIIRHPARIEEGIIEDAIACMQPAGGKRYSEIWVLYMLSAAVPAPYSFPLTKETSPAVRGRKNKARPHSHGEVEIASSVRGKKRIKIITAWRYPGKSSQRDPIPEAILREARKIIYS